MSRPLVFLLFFGILCLAASPAAAHDLAGYQPPAPYGVFSTVSASSPPAGTSAVGFLIEKAGKPDYTRVSTHLCVAVTDTLEVGLNVPYVDADDSGIEDVGYALKWRFRDEGAYGPSFALLLGGTVASSNETYTSEGAIGGGFIASKRLGPVRGHLNLILMNPDDETLENSTRASFGVEFSAAHTFRILAEIYGESTYFANNFDVAEARFGYRFIYGQSVYSTLGIGMAMNNRAPEYRILASLTVLFLDSGGARTERW